MESNQIKSKIKLIVLCRVVVALPNHTALYQIALNYQPTVVVVDYEIDQGKNCIQSPLLHTMAAYGTINCCCTYHGMFGLTRSSYSMGILYSTVDWYSPCY